MTFDAILAEVERRRGEFHELGYVPKDFIEQLKTTGIYRASTPACFGGEPLPPAEFLEKIERISQVDGSTGWVASFGSALIYLAALDPEVQAEIYKDGPDLVFAGGLFPVQEAEPTERGFLVDGRWKFASGCMGADLLGVGIPGGEDTGGKPRTALLPPEQVTIIQEWDVMGMQATGSFDLEVRGVEVPREWTFIRGGEPQIDEPLYRYPVIAYAAQVLAVVGAGVARAMLDFAWGKGSANAGVTGAPALAQRPYYRQALAKAEASLNSARSWFYETTEQVWEDVLAGKEASDEQNAALRLASAHIAEVAGDVATTVLQVSGTGPINRKHPLQRLHGDALVPRQHAFMSPSIYDSAGAVLAGLPPTSPGFR